MSLRRLLGVGRQARWLWHMIGPVARYWSAECVRRGACAGRTQVRGRLRIGDYTLHYLHCVQAAGQHAQVGMRLSAVQLKVRHQSSEQCHAAVARRVPKLLERCSERRVV